MTTGKNTVHSLLIRYILILEHLTVLQQSKRSNRSKRKKKIKAGHTAVKQRVQKNIATHALAAKLLMKDESNTHEVVS